MRAGAGRRCGRLRCSMGMAAPPAAGAEPRGAVKAEPGPAGNAAGREGAVGRGGGTDRRAGTLRARLKRRAGAADASRRAARDGTSGRWGEERVEDRARAAPARAARAYGNAERRWRVVPRARRAAAGGSGRRAGRGHDGGLCGSAALRLCGSAALRLCGSAALRLCGSAALRLCGSAALRLCGSAALRLCGSAALRLCGSAALRLCGSAALRLCGSAALRLCGSLN